MKDINAFYNQLKGKEVARPNGTYKGECVSLCEQWLQYNGWPLLPGNAKDFVNNGKKPYTFIKNISSTIPHAGDLAVFYDKTIAKYGHIGIVMPGANQRVMSVFNQNWPHGNLKDPAKITVFDYTHPKCVGFIRYVG